MTSADPAPAGHRARRPRSPGTPGAPRRRNVVRWARPLLLAAGAVATIAVLAVSVFPTRTWLDQRTALADTERQLESLEAERGALEARLAELDSEAEIELIARSQYGLVRPGEEAYAVLPAPEPPIELPTVWPFGPLLPDDGGD